MNLKRLLLVVEVGRIGFKSRLSVQEHPLELISVGKVKSRKVG